MPEGRDSTVEALDEFRFQDAAGKDTPPSGPGSRARSRSSSGTAAPRRASLESRLAESFAGIGAIVAAFDSHCGTVILKQAPALGKAWNEAAQQNPRVKKALEGLLTGGTFGSAIFVTGVTLLPILQHHGLIPFGFGTRESEEEIPEDISVNGSSATVAS